jgi:phage terminase small subunit
MRGRKPKPTFLHVVEGTLNATRHADRPDTEPPVGAPIKPKWLKRRAARIWDEYAPRLPWLGEIDSAMLAAWCSLYSELEADPTLAAPRISQMRGLVAELGLTPSARTRFKADGEKKRADPATG